jgi:orotidine-5'-phosphate decarboxylase
MAVILAVAHGISPVGRDAWIIAPSASTLAALGRQGIIQFRLTRRRLPLTPGLRAVLLDRSAMPHGRRGVERGLISHTVNAARIFMWYTERPFPGRDFESVMKPTIKDIPLNERIIFALDVDTLEEAQEWVERLGSHVRFYKVGLQLFLGGWFPVIDMIARRGHKVMVDLKFFDLPETVKQAVEQLKGKGVTFATVHGNDPILRAAVENRDSVKILAVTVLTSFDESDMREMGFTGTVEDLVLIRGQKALRLGCDGIVSSGLEAPRLRSELGHNFLIVTPGIRPGANIEEPQDDQRRIVTAQQAIINGADYVVVGRPIRTAPDPIAVVESMQGEIQRGLASLIAT